MPRHISLSILLLAASVAACTKWVANTKPIPVLMSDGTPKLRLYLAVGPTITLSDTWLRNDSIVGVAEDSIEVAVATSNIRFIEKQVTDGFKTVLTLVTVSALVAGSIAMGAAQDDEETVRRPPSYPPTASCPLVYSWDGSGWRLDSGTFGGAITRGLQRTDVDGLDHLTPEAGLLKLRVTNELDETDHLDALELLVVDHPRGTRIAPDAGGGMHVLRDPVSPTSARDYSGADALPRVATADGYGWESPFVLRDTSRLANARDGLELRFPRPAAAEAHLVLDGNNTAWATALLAEWLANRGPGLDAWYAAMNRDRAMARRVGMGIANEAFLTVSMLTRTGWSRQGLYWESGPEVSKRQAIHLDLRNIAGDEVVVRLEAPPSFWWIDAVSLDGAGDDAVRVTALKPAAARSHDDSDPLPRLAAIDDSYLTMETGQWTELDFMALPPRTGTARSYLLSSTGWYHVNVRPRATAEHALLERMETEPGAISRIATGKLNDAIRALSAPR